MSSDNVVAAVEMNAINDSTFGEPDISANGRLPAPETLNGTQEKLNFLPLDLVESMVAQYTQNYDEPTQTVIIVVFALMIAFGAVGNSLVCYVVARNPAMRTPRNIFIIYLAISDLTLCLFTQPFNCIKFLFMIWKFGSFMCKFLPMMAGVNVFVSTISITAIALDRFQVIVYPTNTSRKRFGAVISLVAIWVVAIILASPMLVFNVIEPFAPLSLYVSFDTCVENASLVQYRRVYSTAVLIVQYLLPVAVVSTAHARISRKLRNRMLTLQQRNMADSGVTSSSSPQTGRAAGGGGGRQKPKAGGQLPVSAAQMEKRRMARQRKRKTNLLLVMIAIVFALSWLPLNVFNLIADLDMDLLRSFEEQVGNLVFPACHLMVLCSACVNPLLYGWLNDNFRREFVKVLCTCCSRQPCSGCCRRCVVASTPQSPSTALTCAPILPKKSLSGHLTTPQRQQDIGGSGAAVVDFVIDSPDSHNKAILDSNRKQSAAAAETETARLMSDVNQANDSKEEEVMSAGGAAEHVLIVAEA